MNSDGTSVLTRDCACCGAPEGSVAGIAKHRSCSRCMVTFYCGTKCQREHWKRGGHKQACVAVADRQNLQGGNSGEPPPRYIGNTGGNCSSNDGSASVTATDEEGPSAICTDNTPSSEASHPTPCKEGEGHDVKERADQDAGDVVQQLREAADQGLVTAQNKLGDMYEHGHGTEQSYVDAVEWYGKAAEQGDAAAQYKLGNMYFKGAGVGQSDTTAVEWYRKAADQGYAPALSALGNMHEQGRGTNGKKKGKKRDLPLALEYYRAAAAQGDAEGRYNIGVWFTRGMPGTPQDVVEGLRWLRLAADQGHQGAKKSIKSVTQMLRAEDQRAAEAAEAAAFSAPTDYACRRQQIKNKQAKKVSAAVAVARALTPSSGFSSAVPPTAPPLPPPPPPPGHMPPAPPSPRIPS